MLVPEPLMVGGLKLAVVPAGNPEAASVTTPLNPFRPPTLTVYVPRYGSPAPAIVVPVIVAKLMVKSGGGTGGGTGAADPPPPPGPWGAHDL